jgi:hypothetical protein
MSPLSGDSDTVMEPVGDQSLANCKFIQANKKFQTGENSTMNQSTNSVASLYVTIADIQDTIKVYDAETAQRLTLPGGKSAGPHSFADSRDPIDGSCPPPLPFDRAILLKPLPTDKNEIFRGLVVR